LSALRFIGCAQIFQDQVSSTGIAEGMQPADKKSMLSGACQQMKFDGSGRFPRLFMINNTVDCVLLEIRFILVIRAMMLKKQRRRVIAPAPVEASADLLQTGLSDGKTLTELCYPLLQGSNIRGVAELQSKTAVAAGQTVPADFLVHGEGETIGRIQSFKNIFFFYLHPF
jgi:hypothetical protein